MTTVYKFKAYYTDAGVGAVQDPAPTCTVINMADDSKLADAQATTASTNMPGLYSYEYSGADGLDCVAWFKTTDTGCDVKELASYVSEKITTNLNADVAGVETKLDTVDSNVDAILADTGTDGVKIAGAQTVATVTNLTNLPTMPNDWVTAAGLKADAVAEIADGVWIHDISPYGVGEAGGDLLSWLTIIAGYLNDGGGIDLLIDAIKAKTDNLPASPANEATLTAIKGATWTNQTLEKIVSDIAAISAGGATAQEVWEYATRVLTAGTNIDLSSLATAANLATVDTVVDAIKAKTDTIPASPAQAGEYTAAIAAIPTTPLLAANYTAPDNAGIAAIKAKTDNLPADPADDSDIDATLTTIINYLTAAKGLLENMGGTVWANPTRTLTNSTSGATVPAQGETLEIYKDSTVTINFTGLGDVSGLSSDTSGQEDKVWFTAKKSLDDLDASSIIQIHVLYPAGSNPPDTLDYIEGAEATADEGTFQFTDTTTGAATLTLTAAATADLSIYVASPLYWDIKSLDYSTGIVNILASGQMYIYGTPTKSIS